MFIVITGNPVDGFSYFGPYENAQDATDDAGEAVLALDWWVAPLLSVDELNDPNGDAAELPDPTPPPVITVTYESVTRSFPVGWPLSQALVDAYEAACTWADSQTAPDEPEEPDNAYDAGRTDDYGRHGGPLED